MFEKYSLRLPKLRILVMTRGIWEKLFKLYCFSKTQTPICYMRIRILKNKIMKTKLPGSALRDKSSIHVLCLGNVFIVHLFAWRRKLLPSVNKKILLTITINGCR